MASQTLTMDTKPRKLENLFIKKVGEEFLVYNQKGESIHILNETAAFIFDLCTGDHTLKDIAGKLRNSFEVSGDIESDVKETIENLESLKLLEEE